MDTVKLVAEIEKRPVLYDARIAIMSSRELKPAMWLEVGRETVPEWESLSLEDRQKRGIALRPNPSEHLLFIQPEELKNSNRFE